MTAHTPGPWRTEPTTSDSLGVDIVCGERLEGTSKWVAAVHGSHDGYIGFPSDDEGKANAHLIAAAPELLEACKRALNSLDLDIAAMDQLKKAIAAAEGRS